MKYRAKQRKLAIKNDIMELIFNVLTSFCVVLKLKIHLLTTFLIKIYVVAG